MPNYRYVYVLRSLADHQFYVGLTRDLRARLHLHNKGLIASTKKTDTVPACLLGGLFE